MAVRVRVPLAALSKNFFYFNMRKNIFYLLSACSLFVLASCSKMGPLSADNFTVNPIPLETQGGQVPATINGTFPAKYMKKKAVVTVTPELRYADGKVSRGDAATFQGEKVMGNDQTISYKLGGRYNMKTSFTFKPGMEKSDMYLTFDAKVGKKLVEIPAVKVAYGVVATSELYRNTLNGNSCFAPDTFQRVNEKKLEANIKFLVNQANLRKSELKNNSVQEFVKMLKEINADREGLNVRNVEVLAYASPEGGFEFNDKLASKRQSTSEDYVKKQLKETKVDANIAARYTAQDWDGFQQLVQVSNIQDKDVILRVLSMYKDPEEREQQIRNMSAVFRELADGILPELRRSRLIINYETIGRSDDQIQEQYTADASKLSADELLYAATLEESDAKKKEIYETTTKLYDKDYRAYNNLAALAFAEGNDAKAKEYLNKAFSLNAKAPEANGTLALMALKNGDLEQAEANLSKAVDAQDFNAVLGNLNIAKGNYAQAEQNFDDATCNSAALAQILNKNYAKATSTLRAIKNRDAMTEYLTAIVNARQGNTSAAADALKLALQKDPSLAAYAANDIELAKVSK